MPYAAPHDPRLTVLGKRGPLVSTYSLNPLRMKNLCFLTAMASLASLRAASSYDLIDLGAGAATAINASGRVVGTAPTGGWLHDGTQRTNIVVNTRVLFAPPALIYQNINIKLPLAISDSGRIAGSFPPVQNFIEYGVVYPGSGLAVAFEDWPSAAGVNDAGQTVGPRGLYFDGTNPVSVPGTNPDLYAINASGVAVGSVVDPTLGLPVPARFVSGALEPLSLAGLPSPAPSAWTGQANAINTDGVIVGHVFVARQRPLDPMVAFVHANGATTLIDSLGGVRARANGINDSGIIVGSTGDSSGATRAFVHEGGVSTDLNTLLSSGGEGWILSSASAVNASGWIVGAGTKNGEQRAFLLKPASGATPPSITQQPSDISVFQGDPFSLSVLGSGAGPLSYQWQHAGTNLPGAGTQTHSVAQALFDHAGEYRAIVSNSAGSITSAVARVVVKVRPELTLRQFAGISVRGVVGKSYRIEAAEQPGAPWTGLKTLTLETSPTLWFDLDSPAHHRRVYRVVEAP